MWFILITPWHVYFSRLSNLNLLCKKQLVSGGLSQQRELISYNMFYLIILVVHAPVWLLGRTTVQVLYWRILAYFLWFNQGQCPMIHCTCRLIRAKILLMIQTEVGSEDIYYTA